MVVSPRDLVLLGPVGAGKGTQARRIASTHNLLHLASGDLLRAHRTNKTELGCQAQLYMDRGELVPDQLVIKMIIDRMQQPDAAGGVLLDGFPRTVVQAQALDGELAKQGRALRLAIYLDVPFEVLVQRAAGRWTCRTDGATYNYLVNPPRVAGICDIDGGPLYQREDDRLDIVSERIKVYLRDTVPVLDYYRERGILHRVDGTLGIDAVSEQIEERLEAAV